MNDDDARRLIAGAVGRRAPSPQDDATWHDLGAGTGTFTVALAHLLGRAATVHAVERDARSIETLRRQARDVAADARSATVVVHRADFEEPLDLPPADGILMANSLHFVAYDAQAALLRRLTTGLGVGGRVVLVEYDSKTGTRWVPYPIAMASLPRLAAAAGLQTPSVTATMPSAFGGTLYCAVSTPR